MSGSSAAEPVQTATDFVAEFVGVDRGARALHLKHTPHGTVLVDAAGRTQGVLQGEDAAASVRAVPTAPPGREP